MVIFHNCLKMLSILTLLAGGVGGCSASGTHGLGAHGGVSKLLQVGALERIAALG